MARSGGHDLDRNYDIGATTPFEATRRSVLSYAYDLSGRRTSRTDHLSGTQRYAYDALGQLASTTDRAVSGATPSSSRSRSTHSAACGPRACPRRASRPRGPTTSRDGRPSGPRKGSATPSSMIHAANASACVVAP
ncbi:MAG: RHS repeat protein [Gemmatimonadetes bacterium]|nr:RHS repeat protein [Gemmatimonadota bacterium]